MRDRQMAWGLLRLFGDRSGKLEPDLVSLRKGNEARTDPLRILDSDSFSAINRVLRGMPGYKHSQFVPTGRNGEALADGSINVDLEEMPFPADSFDIIMTSDVMEHVLRDDRAHEEIFRCLAPGGTYLFTVPYDPTLSGHRRLTQLAGDTYFILERHIHGDPHSASGIIAHRIYGGPLSQDLQAFGYSVRFEMVDCPANGIFGGDLFFARKDDQGRV